MATMKELKLALEVVTEGAGGYVPEALRAEAASTQGAARPWTMGEGIQAVGIGEKVTDRHTRDDLVLKVYVEKKRPEREVTNLVPREVAIPGVAQPVPTDVEEIGKVTIEPNTTRVRPAPPGHSVGHLNITAGTFGCLVRKRGDPTTLYILSNSHVLADEGVGSVGDPIVQPGPLDGGVAPADVIAALAEWVPFQFSSASYPNLVDAAIARVNDPAAVDAFIRLIGVPVGVSTTVRRGMRVQKTGRTTDYTQGIIRDVNLRLALDYKRPGGGTGRVGLRDQVLCTRYTAGGDSGSAVLNMKGRVVGLHFAGSPSSSIFNRIRNVQDALQIDVVT